MSSAPPRRVLVVEDELAIRELLRLHLELAGFVLEETGDGRRALDAARARPFDLILLDVMLPGLDGVSVCQAIRRDSPNRGTPILMVTGARRRSRHGGGARERRGRLCRQGAGGRTDEFTSQLYFDDPLTDRIHAAAPYGSKTGQRLLNTRDMIFREGGTKLILPVVATQYRKPSSFQ